MTEPRAFASDIAFTAAVKEIQTRKGSRRAYASMEAGDGWSTAISGDVATFIAQQTSVFFATANAARQPYIQHRGGPPGFLHVLDEHTLAFADFRGNRQYITAGNLSENPKAYLFLIDYAHQRRLKIWGTARVIDNDPALLARLMPPDYAAKPEQAIVFHVEAWDRNCPQHIPQRFEAADVATALAERDSKIASLEAEIAALRGGTRA